MFRMKTKIVVSIFCMLIASCSSNGPAPVVDLSYSSSSKAITKKSATKHNHSNIKRDPLPDNHSVKPGETLYSIAWRYSLDHRMLAKVNQINDNTIYPGQKLILSPAQQPLFNSNSLVRAVKRDVLKQTNIRASSVASNKYNKHSSKLKKASPSNNPIKQSVERWIWPVNGKVIEKFSNRSNMNKGLDIVAKRGAPVRATAKGKVVYSGDGLRGYGQLVIIKHNDAYLSAYAHNDKIHVRENEFVKAGQKIADLGRTDSDRDKLHFEIRYKGKPVDPLKYLPKSEML